MKICKGFHETFKGDTTIIVNGKEIKGEWIKGYFFKLTKPYESIRSLYHYYIIDTTELNWGYGTDDGGMSGYILSEYQKDFKEVIPETIGELVKDSITIDTENTYDKVFSIDILEIESSVKRPDWKDNPYAATSIKRLDIAEIRWNDNKLQWELKVYHEGIYKRIANAGWFLRQPTTRVIGTIFDKK